MVEVEVISELEDNIKYLFHPKSIAVVGASTDSRKMSGRVVNFMVSHRSSATIYPINPKEEVKEIFGVPCFHSIDEIKGSIDQVIIALPAALVADQLKKCAKLGVKAAVIFSSGFAESGEKGIEMQRELAEIAKTAKIAVCGPNCQGIINLDKNIISSMTNVLCLKKIVRGNVGFVSQSGALAGSILSLAQKEKIGFSHWVSVGNEAVIGIADFLKYMVSDPATLVIAAYIEGVKNVQQWRKVFHDAIHAEKPILYIKSGRSEAGSMAVSSHTGSIAGEDFIAESFFQQNGAVRVSEIEEMFDSMMMFSTGKRPGKGRVGIITSSGGAGIIVADACSDYNVPLAALSIATKETLLRKLPKFASILNPVDVTAQLFQMVFTEDLELYKNCLRDMLSDPGINVLIIALTMVMGERAKKIAEDIVEISKETDKPIAVIWLAGDMAREGYQILRDHNIPLYFSGSRCVKALKNAVDYYENLVSLQLSIDERESLSGQTVCTRSREKALELLNKGRNCLTENEGREILALYGISMPQGLLISKEDELDSRLNTLRYPLVMKIDSPDILHRTDAHCVITNIEDKKKACDTFRKIINNAKDYKPNCRINGILVEEMVEGDSYMELIVGVKNDPIFGPAMILGIGGIFVEIFNEIVCRVLPLTRIDVTSMIKSLRFYKVIEGARGNKPLDIQALEDTLLKISQFAWDCKELIAEVDINPLFVLQKGRGVRAADVLIFKSGHRENQIP